MITNDEILSRNQRSTATDKGDAQFCGSGVKLYDQLISANAVFEADGPFAPGETIGTAAVKYTVTAADVLMGSIANRAYDVITETNDLYLSNEVNVVLDADAAVRYSPVTVIKTVTGTPANGVYYTEGEEVTYSVTAVNGGSEDVAAVILYDCLNSGSPKVIETASALGAHGSISADYTYTVTAEDVARGYIDNYAYAVYVSGTQKRAVSYTVRVDTDGVSDPVPGGAIRRLGQNSGENGGQNSGAGSDGTMCFGLHIYILPHRGARWRCSISRGILSSWIPHHNCMPLSESFSHIISSLKCHLRYCLLPPRIWAGVTL